MCSGMLDTRPQATPTLDALEAQDAISFSNAFVQATVLHAKSMFVYDQIVRQPPSFRAGGCQENTTTERSDSMPKSSLRILTSAPGTLNWFEEHAQEKLKTGTAVSLAHAQQLVAEDYQSGDWSAIVQFSKECGVLLDNNTICFERGLRADRETAWRWLVTRELLAKWHIPTEMEFPGRRQVRIQRMRGLVLSGKLLRDSA